MSHRCHAVACTKTCKPEFLMCGAHWRMVPRALQREVWRTYRVGQCDDKNPSEDWMRAADRAIVAVAIEEGHTLTGRLARIAWEMIEDVKPKDDRPVGTNADGEDVEILL